MASSIGAHDGFMPQWASMHQQLAEDEAEVGRPAPPSFHFPASSYADRSRRYMRTSAVSARTRLTIVR